MKHYAVIGSGFGDCGKGHITEYLTSIQENSPLVVRHNGGSQAGHTVIGKNVHGEKQQHIFSHVGSGSLLGGLTYLAPNFIAEPRSLAYELQELFQNFRVLPEIHAHQDCRLTTVFDIYLNRVRELQRGSGRHGSCGLGINETVTRNLQGPPLRLQDILEPNLSDKIYRIYKEWFIPRLAEIPHTKIDSESARSFLPDIDIEKEIACHADVRIMTIGQAPPNPRYVSWIFESAQGLMLDEYLGTFPHVTRSITGLLSAVQAALPGMTIHPVYVTRTYSTRHGAGVLLHEGEHINFKDLSDTTNKTGKWQAHFRYAPLDIHELDKFINADLDRSLAFAKTKNVTIESPIIALTHADKLEDKTVVYNINSEKLFVNEGQLIDELRKILPVKLISYGPHYSDVYEC